MSYMADISAAPQLERHGRLMVVRDDLMAGGTKERFLPYLVQGASEVVYGSPFCGGAAVALSAMGRATGQKVTIFYAKRKLLVPRQRRVLRNGAALYQVPTGYMSNVQSKARAYAQWAGALFLPLGFDLPAAQEPLVAAMRAVRLRIGQPSQVWCATGSGMLARCLGLAFPASEVIGVAVGLESRHGQQAFSPNVRLIPAIEKFDHQSRARAPFPCCGYYDRKAWAMAAQGAKDNALFWNVMGED